MFKHYSIVITNIMRYENIKEILTSDKVWPGYTMKRYLRLCHKSINIYNNNYYWFVFFIFFYIFAINIGTQKWLDGKWYEIH